MKKIAVIPVSQQQNARVSVFLSSSFYFFAALSCRLRAPYLFIITRIRVLPRDKFVQKLWAVARMDI